MSERLKGQEVSVVFVSATEGLESAITDVRSLDIQFDLDTMDEGYLGQTSNQRDDIYKGMSGKAELHIQSADILSLIQRIVERSRRRLPGETIQIIATFNFPTGGRRRIMIPDCKFGNIPINIASRSDYASVSFEFTADDGRVLAA